MNDAELAEEIATDDSHAEPQKPPRKAEKIGAPRKRPSFFLVAPDDDGMWHWALMAGNGKAHAVSHQLYKRVYDAKQAVKDMVEMIRKDELTIEVED